MVRNHDILGALRRHPGMTREAIAKELRCKEEDLVKPLWSMLYDGEVQVTEDLVWSCTGKQLHHIGRCLDCGTIDHQLQDGQCPNCRRGKKTTTEHAA